MTDNFFDDFQIKSNKNLKETKFSLIESISSGNCCIYCVSLGSRCTLHQGNRIFDVPKPALDAIRNPSKIIGEKIIEDNNLEFGNKRLHFNTCIFNYAHDSCKNCEEGRFKEIKYKDTTLKFCYPILKDNTNVIPIGFHWTFNMTCKGNEIIDLEVYPFDKNNNFNNVKKSIKGQEHDIKFNEDNFPNMELKQKNINKNENKNIWHDFPKEKHSIDNESDSKDIDTYEKTNLKLELNSNNLEKKNREIEILLKENKAQKEAISGLKATISLDTNIQNNDDFQKKINDLENIIHDNEKIYKQKMFKMRKEIESYDENIKKLNNTIYDLEKSYNFSEKDLKNIKNGCKNFSNVLFDSFVHSYNNCDF